MRPARIVHPLLLGGTNRLAIALLAASIWLSPALSGAENTAETQAIARAALDYRQRLEAATEDLAVTRARIAAERVPLAGTQREWQDRVLALEVQVARIETDAPQTAARLAELQREIDSLNQNLGYLSSLGRDALRGLKDSLLPGEAAELAAPIATLEQQLENPAQLLNASLALDASALIMPRLHRLIGGHLAPGSSLLNGDNELLAGTFLWLGPEVLFQAGSDGVIGTVRAFDGVTHPITHPLVFDDEAAVRQLFRGEAGVFAADASGGMALRLEEARGTWVDHLERGGAIGYIILGLGGLALLTTLLKLTDIRHVTVDRPDVVRQVLASVRNGSPDEGAKAVASLHPTVRELLDGGLQHLDKPKVVLEDNLYAILLRQRMHLERRLPFLTVIVAAAPLLGLLGTVTGMVKTFTLINVFGTGNAAKLSSGISEALVTTELGLMVAIPTLVIHGYLSRRTQKNLALLERYAAEFVAVASERADNREPEAVRS